MDSTIIRVHGNGDYWNKVGVLAKLRRTSVAALVKEAIDERYGDNLSAIEPIFFLENVAEQQRSNKEGNDE